MKQIHTYIHACKQEIFLTGYTKMVNKAGWELKTLGWEVYHNPFCTIFIYHMPMYVL